MIFHNLSLCLHYLNDYPTIPLKYFKTYNLTEYEYMKIIYVNCTGIARSWVRIPFKPEFFSGCFFNCLS